LIAPPPLLISRMAIQNGITNGNTNGITTGVDKDDLVMPVSRKYACNVFFYSMLLKTA
jgi:hypothetical protein